MRPNGVVSKAVGQTVHAVFAEVGVDRMCETCCMFEWLVIESILDICMVDLSVEPPSKTSP